LNDGAVVSHHRQSGAQPPELAIGHVQVDPHRHALRDFGDVSRGVFSGEDAELCSRSWRQAVQMPVPVPAGYRPELLQAGLAAHERAPG
jgi:hypothetical protein